jgi:hypothetical protein
LGLGCFSDPRALLRVLRPARAGWPRLVLEAMRPRGSLGAAAGLYFFGVAPRLGAVLAGRAELYDLLRASTLALGDLTSERRREPDSCFGERRE